MIWALCCKHPLSWALTWSVSRVLWAIVDQNGVEVASLVEGEGVSRDDVEMAMSGFVAGLDPHPTCQSCLFVDVIVKLGVLLTLGPLR